MTKLLKLFKITCSQLGKISNCNWSLNFIFSNYDFQSYGQKTINQVDLYTTDGSNISRTVHDQGDSYLCWVYSIASSLKCTVRYFIDKLKLSTIQRERCLDKLNDKNLHHSIRMELCMLIPTLVNQIDEKQAMSVVSVLRRVSLDIFY